MVVCRYFLQGSCRFGDNCKNEHPGARTASFANQNRFGALQNQGDRSGIVAGSNGGRKDAGWSINANDVKNDLTSGTGRPQWILSTYGPGKNGPASLLEGNEYSPEELRVRFYELASKGNQAQADQEAGTLWAKSEQEMSNIANHSEDVIKFMEEAEKKHPNRYDFCKSDGSKTREQITKEAESASPFGGSSEFGAGSGFGPALSAGGAFGKPPLTGLGQPAASSGFGSTGFGQPLQPSAFGQPAGTNTFGKPAFGGTGFGQASSFGQPAKPASAFGQPSQPTSAFGQPAQPSAFGQPAQPSAFGQPNQPSAFGKTAQASAFGQPAQGSAFGSPGFGNAAANNSPFAAPSATSSFGQATQPTSAFGQPAQLGSAFGQPSQSTSAFGQPSSFGSGTAFGKPSMPGFGQSSQPITTAFGQQPKSTPSAFGKPTTPNVFGSGSAPAFGSTTESNNPFGQRPATGSADLIQPAANITSNPFGQQSEPQGSVFGQPMRSSPTPPINPFGNAPVTMTPAFGSGTSASPAPSSIPGFNNDVSALRSNPLINKPSRPLHYTQTLGKNTGAQTDRSQKLISYNGRRVKYMGETPVYEKDRQGELQVRHVSDIPCYERPDGKGWERIWFPQAGATPEVVALTSRPDKLDELQMPDEAYTDAVKEEWKELFDRGRFIEGRMPLVPPRREWVLYDF